MLWNVIMAITAVISMVAYVLTALYIRDQLKGQQKDRFLSVTNDLFTIWQERAFMEAQLWLIHRLEESTWPSFVARHRCDYGEVAFHRVDRRTHARVVRRQEADQRQQQQTRINTFAAHAIDEMSTGLVPAALHHLGPDSAPQHVELPQPRWFDPIEPLAAQEPVHACPGYRHSVGVVLRLPARFPKPVALVLPGFLQPVDQPVFGFQRLRRRLHARSRQQIECIQQFAHNIDLALRRGVVPVNQEARAALVKDPVLKDTLLLGDDEVRNMMRIDWQKVDLDFPEKWARAVAK